MNLFYFLMWVEALIFKDGYARCNNMEKSLLCHQVCVCLNLVNHAVLHVSVSVHKISMLN